MDTVQQLERRRNAVLEQMRAIRSLRHGTINEQYFPASVKGALAGGLRGPYYVLSRNEGGKTVSQRLTAELVEQARTDVAAHQRFVSLCQEYERLTEQLGQVERGAGAGPEKKRRS
jgi:hypothetical protein